MSESMTPDDPERESGALISPAPDTNPPLRIFTRPWFWVLVVGTLWSFPLFKSLGAEFPDPLAGYDSEPLEMQFLEESGREVSLSDLGGFLKIVSTLDLSSPQLADHTFDQFRVMRKRVRGLGSMAVQLVLVRGATSAELSAFVAERTARRPNNLFLIDPLGEALAEFQTLAESREHELFVLDRHARLRGVYGISEAEGDRFAQELGKLANWEGSDPEPGSPIRR